jgi:hypothetical protein
MSGGGKFRADAKLMQKPADVTKPLQTLERAKGIEPSFRRIPFYSSAYLCFTREKLAPFGQMSYIKLHSKEWRK